MKRANVSDIRKALVMANDLARAGIEFVAVPVLSDADRAELIQRQVKAIGSFLGGNVEPQEEMPQG